MLFDGEWGDSFSDIPDYDEKGLSIVATREDLVLPETGGNFTSSLNNAHCDAPLTPIRFIDSIVENRFTSPSFPLECSYHNDGCVEVPYHSMSNGTWQPFFSVDAHRKGNGVLGPMTEVGDAHLIMQGFDLVWMNKGSKPLWRTMIKARNPEAITPLSRLCPPLTVDGLVLHANSAGLWAFPDSLLSTDEP
jgi:hypothetical protein